MTTLLTVSNSEGERRCDSRCYNAKRPDCDCCCAGRNHGVGLKRAMDNTMEFAKEMVKEYERRIGRKVRNFQIGDAVPGDLFND